MSNEETKRDRVRRLLITPLSDDGFRFKRGSDESKCSRDLDRIADSLSHMSDLELERMRACLITKGEGAARNFWPSVATVLAFAEFVHPRPLEAVPELLSWFRSRAGEAALKDGRLVAEYLFWEQKKRPPMSAMDKKRVADDGIEYEHKATLLREKQAAGRSLMVDDVQWLDWYEELSVRLTRMVEEGVFARGQEDAA